MIRNKRFRTDVIVLGGGCAGLSLASRMAESRTGPAMIVVESRAAYQEDRTWCGWRLNPHFFDDCVVREWNSWQVVDNDGEQLQASDEYPYEMVSAAKFYEKACGLISASESVKLLTGATVVAVKETPAQVDVHLADGTVLCAPWVIDTRPKTTELGWPWIWQSFVGYVVDAERPHGLGFDATPTLMNFQAEEGHVAQFVYVLPLSPTQFLVEWTRLSKNNEPLAAIEGRLTRWLDEYTPRWQLVRRESGSLPMAVPVKEPSAPRIVRAGMRGGSMRASSGYAFHAIQRWADDCAASLVTEGFPVPPVRSRLLEALDGSFLSVLQTEPGAARELFTELFAHCPADPLVRFLAGQPKVSDYWPVIASLPWRRFLPTVPTAIGQWCRA